MLKNKRKRRFVPPLKPGDPKDSNESLDTLEFASQFSSYPVNEISFFSECAVHNKDSQTLSQASPLKLALAQENSSYQQNCTQEPSAPNQCTQKCSDSNHICMNDSLETTELNKEQKVLL